MNSNQNMSFPATAEQTVDYIENQGFARAHARQAIEWVTGKELMHGAMYTQTVYVKCIQWLEDNGAPRESKSVELAEGVTVRVIKAESWFIGMKGDIVRAGVNPDTLRAWFEVSFKGWSQPEGKIIWTDGIFFAEDIEIV